MVVSTPALCTFMRCFARDGEPRDKGNPLPPMNGSWFNSTTSMIWRPAARNLPRGDGNFHERDEIRGKDVEVEWMPFELRPEPHPSLRPEGDYLQRAWQDSVYPIARQMGVPIQLPPVSPQPHSHLAFEGFQFKHFAADGCSIHLFDAVTAWKVRHLMPRRGKIQEPVHEFLAGPKEEVTGSTRTSPFP